jgi:hypothetical protein
MKILFTHSLRKELIDLGYLYVAYFDGSDHTILSAIRSEPMEMVTSYKASPKVILPNLN